MNTYRVWCPDYGHEGPEDGMLLGYAYDARDAAQTWAMRHDRDSGEFTIVRGTAANVMVQAPDGTVTTWTVYGETAPVYSATEAK